MVPEPAFLRNELQFAASWWPVSSNSVATTFSHGFFVDQRNLDRITTTCFRMSNRSWEHKNKIHVRYRAYTPGGDHRNKHFAIFFDSLARAKFFFRRNKGWIQPKQAGLHK